MNTNFNPLSRFLCFCSGANLELLDKECPSEISKYASMGATVLFTGIFATISGGYALHRVFVLEENAIWYSVAFGILWGLMIFNLDRYIVMSMRKEGKPMNEFLQAIPRILIALLISIVIAKPLEVKIFESRIARQIYENEQEKLSSDIQAFDERHGQTNLAERIKGIEQKVEALVESRSEDPRSPYFTELLESLRAKESAYGILSIEKSKLMNDLQSKINSIYANEQIITQDSLGRSKKYLPPSARSRVNTLVRTRNAHKNELQSAERKLEDLKAQVEAARLAHRHEVDSLLADSHSNQDLLAAKKAKADSVVNLEIEQADEINQVAFSNNFITQLEALGELTNQEDLEGEGQRNTILEWTGLFLSLLFLVIELAPVLVKLISKQGTYDRALAASQELEHAKNVESKNTEFAITQSHQADLIQAKSSLFSAAIAKFKVSRMSLLESLSYEELKQFFIDIANFRVEPSSNQVTTSNESPYPTGEQTSSAPENNDTYSRPEDPEHAPRNSSATEQSDQPYNDLGQRHAEDMFDDNLSIEQSPLDTVAPFQNGDRLDLEDIHSFDQTFHSDHNDLYAPLTRPIFLNTPTHNHVVPSASPSPQDNQNFSSVQHEQINRDAPSISEARSVANEDFHEPSRSPQLEDPVIAASRAARNRSEPNHEGGENA